MSDSKDLQVARPGTMPAMTSGEFQKMWADFQQFVRDSLVEGVDFGKIPGIDRPTLLQPGAQKIASKYFARPEYEILPESIQWLGSTNPNKAFKNHPPRTKSNPRRICGYGQKGIYS